MKPFAFLVCATGLVLSAFAQTSCLEITTNKTTSLVFPFPVKHVDRGTSNVLVQQVKEADNILLVKAATENFCETNLSIVTTDGSVYSFTVSYNEKPSSLVYHLPAQSSVSLSTYANSILDNPQTMNGITDQKWDMVAKLTGIYIKEGIFYYQLQLENKSTIDYDIDLLRFCIRDKKKSKRTAIQEIELKPLFVAGNSAQVKAGSHTVVVTALEKFTIPDAKYLGIGISEKNGGRNLLLKIPNRKIMKAIPLPDLK
jgi:conjugative transposon TraN protein